ncbi:MAG: hypothetical protein GXX95_01105 [Methanomassiliicoccus sp.]|nr:hypothetical protein [Methanomassiliicoccus sp.]
MDPRYFEDYMKLAAGHADTARMCLNKAMGYAESAACFASEGVDVQKVRKLVENGLAEALDGVQHLADLMSYLVEAASAPMAPAERLVAVMESDR